MRRARTPPDFSAEAALAERTGGPVAGIDEAGRGPWAGPVVAAAVVLEAERIPPGLFDSKTMTARRRAAALVEIERVARIGVGLASVAEIERLNVLGAGDLAMCRAVAALVPAPSAVLVDGNRLPRGLALPGEALIGGDGRAASIAAASIVAKVTRDRIMDRLATAHPGYGWERNRGYGTAEHRSALERLGVTAEHRRGFRPIHNILCAKGRPST